MRTSENSIKQKNNRGRYSFSVISDMPKGVRVNSCKIFVYSLVEKGTGGLINNVENTFFNI